MATWVQKEASKMSAASFDVIRRNAPSVRRVPLAGSRCVCVLAYARRENNVFVRTPLSPCARGIYVLASEYSYAPAGAQILYSSLTYHGVMTVASFPSVSTNADD